LFLYAVAAEFLGMASAMHNAAIASAMVEAAALRMCLTSHRPLDGFPRYEID